MSTAKPLGARIESLDQFRGYTVAGMFLVNFLGAEVIHPIFDHHNTYNSYADTIMPHFFFAVGFAYRLTLLRRLNTLGPVPTYLRVLRRNFGLILIGWIVYHLDGEADTWAQLKDLGLWGFLTTSFQRSVFQTLVHIAVTSLWVMPVMAAGPWVRAGFLVFSAGLHVVLSYWFYFEFAWTRPVIDGGPLGFLTWTIPLLIGSFAYDAIAANRERPPVGRLSLAAIAIMLVGYAFSGLSMRYMDPETPTLENRADVAASPVIPPASSEFSLTSWETWEAVIPFTPPPEQRKMNYWMMSQRAGTLSYLTFAAGFSLLVYVVFVLLSDIGGIQLGIFSTFGKNALAGYILHDLVDSAVGPFVPDDSSIWWVMFAFAVFFGVNYLIIRHLEKNGIFLRL